MRSIAGGRIVLLSIIYDFVFFSGIAGTTEWLNIFGTVFAATKYGNNVIDCQLHIVFSTAEASVTIEVEDGVPFLDA